MLMKNLFLALALGVALNASAQYEDIVVAGDFAFEGSSNFAISTDILEGQPVAVSTNSGNDTKSILVATFTVPEGKSGVLSWKGSQEAISPNGLAVFLNGATPDGYPKMNYSTMDPVDLSSTYYLSEGNYTLEFYFFITRDHYASGSASTRERCYIYDLSLVMAGDGAQIDTEAIDFGHDYFDNLPVVRHANVTLTNLSEEPLRVTEVVTDGIFTGTTPEGEAGYLETLSVRLSSAIDKVGSEQGVVIIRTNLGDFEVACTASAEALPYDYSPIVTEGDFSFNTSIDYPFVVEGNTAYNSTSDQSYDHTVSSFLEASFAVPEGQIGQLSWTGLVATYWGWQMMDSYQWEDALLLSIDGGEARIFDGVQSAGSDQYSAADLTFTEGLHTVRFDYVKTQEYPSYEGDRFTISDLALSLFTPAENQAVISATELALPTTTQGRRSRAYVSVENQGLQPLSVTAVDCQAPFSAKVNGENVEIFGSIEVEFLFDPTEVGTFSQMATISTTAGNFEVNLTAEATSISGTALLFEDFEGNLDGWTLVDADQDGSNWILNTTYDIDYYDLTAHEGRQALMSTSWDPVTYISSTPDNYAISPAFTVPADGATYVSLFVGLQSGMRECFDILVGTDDDCQTWESIYSHTYTSSAYGEDVWEEAEATIPEAYAGKEVRVALRHHDSNGEMWIRIDDLLVATTSSAGIASISTDKDSYNVYTLDGICVLRNANRTAISTLSPAIYIINGKKVLIQ